MSRRPAAVLVALALLLAWPAGARAGGFIVVDEPTPGRAVRPLEVATHRVTVEVENGVAVTRVEQSFHNPNAQRLEGTFLFPLPEGAAIDRFRMDVDGTMTDAELLPADEARSIYEGIVRRQRDPALLEYAGRGAFKARVFPIEPNGDKRITLGYTQVLRPDSGATEYRYELTAPGASDRPTGSLSVKVAVKSDAPVRSVYSPSHDVDATRDGDRRATAGFERSGATPAGDFVLAWSTAADPVGVTVLTHRPDPSEPGYFLLMASPGAGDADAKVVARDVCLVIDTSGSMAGPKLDQAKRALLFCLANLNDGDRFDVVRFSTEAEPLFGDLRPADAGNVKKARAFVEAMKPAGGTAIGAALGRAALLRGGDERADDNARPFVTLFMTDGLPTIGETDADELVAAATKDDVVGRVFAFGIGNDVNTVLLDRLAAESGAFSQYVGPEEDIEVRVSELYAKIASPVLTGVTLAVGGDDGDGVRVSKVQPGDLPDLYRGQTLLAFGRYDRAGTARVTVAGTEGGEARSFSREVNFPADEPSRDYVARLWAARRVGFLLDQIRLSGESAELRDEVASLARAHGIVTPYTAYLIVEDEARRNVPVAAQTLRDFADDAPARDRAEAAYKAASADSDDRVVSGEAAVKVARQSGGYRRADNAQQAQAANEADLDALAKPPVADAASAGGAGGGGLFGGGGGGGPAAAPAARPAAANYAQQAKVVAGRAFYQNGPVWTDAAVQDAPADAPRQEVAFGSDAYFDLLAKYPEIAPWLAVGPQVDVLVGGTVYNVR